MRHPAYLALPVIGLILIAVAIGASRLKPVPQKPAEATARQLAAENGIIPVEIEGLKLQLISPHTIKETRLDVVNHTAKTITAIGLTYEIHVLDAGGSERVIGDTTATDYLLTNDIHKTKPIQPGKKDEMLNLDAELDQNLRITGEVVSIDYVEFDDHSTLGPDKHASATIKANREGAAKYKAWLRNEYQKHDRNVLVILPLLDDKKLPADLQLTGQARGGANMWRVHLKEHYQAHGKEGIEEVLNQ